MTAPPPYSYDPPPGQRHRQPRERHLFRNLLLGAVCLIILIIIIVIATSHGGGAPAPAAAGSSAPAAAASSSSPAAARSVKNQTITYIVTGTAGASVTYGPSGSNITGRAPMRITRKLRDPSYYAISAQLQGSGDVSCRIEVDGKVVSSGNADGGYNIASCEISQDPLTGKWQNDQ